MTEKATGIVKSLRQDGASVCIDVDTDLGPQTVWFDLDSRVKPDYIVRGSKCEFNYESSGEEGTNNLLVFIKCEKPAQRSYPGGGFRTPAANNYKPIPLRKKIEVETSNWEIEMRRMSALKASGLIYSGTGKEKEFKLLTKQIVEYIETGAFADPIPKSVQTQTEPDDYI